MLIEYITEHISQEDSESSLGITFKRTNTGIISNRRPVRGTAVDSGATTPDSDTSRLSLLANAKREAAKRGLYSRFFRGPVLGSREMEVLDGASQREPASPMSKAADLESVEVARSTKRKYTGGGEDWEERKRRKKLKEADRADKKRAKEKYKMKPSVPAKHSEDARLRKERKRAAREAKRTEQIAGATDDSREMRKGKRNEKVKNKAREEVEETLKDTRDNALACMPHNDDGNSTIFDTVNILIGAATS